MHRFDLNGLRKALAENPELANTGIPLSEEDPRTAHPLHRISDGVFNKTFTQEQGVEIAKVLLEYGADVNGGVTTVGKDTPLTAACSLYADQVAIFLIERGANIHHRGLYGGTALHWAAWTGRDKVVDRLIREGAEIHIRCITFKGTPFIWGVHGYSNGGPENRHHQVACVELLLKAGADKSDTNIDGDPAISFLKEGDEEMARLIR